MWEEIACLVCLRHVFDVEKTASLLTARDGIFFEKGIAEALVDYAFKDVLDDLDPGDAVSPTAVAYYYDDDDRDKITHGGARVPPSAPQRPRSETYPTGCSRAAHR